MRTEGKQEIIIDFKIFSAFILWSNDTISYSFTYMRLVEINWLMIFLISITCYVSSSKSVAIKGDIRLSDAIFRISFERSWLQFYWHLHWTTSSLNGKTGNSKKGTIDDKDAFKTETDFFSSHSLLSIALQHDIDLNNF